MLSSMAGPCNILEGNQIIISCEKNLLSCQLSLKIRGLIKCDFKKRCDESPAKNKSMADVRHVPDPKGKGGKCTFVKRQKAASAVCEISTFSITLVRPTGRKRR